MHNRYETNYERIMAVKTSGVCDRLRNFLSSLCCESTIVTLTLISTLAITGEILVRYGILTAPPSGKNSTAGSSPGDSGSIGEDVMVTVEKVFHYTSLAISGIFFIEIILKIFAFRWRFVFSLWQDFDMLIVLAAVMVEIAFEVEKVIPELEAITFVVIFRLWRLPHACNIKAMKTRRTLEQEIEVWKAGKMTTDEKYTRLELRYNKQKVKLSRLKLELSVLGKGRQDYTTDDEIKSEKLSAGNVRNGAVPRDSGSLKRTHPLPQSKTSEFHRKNSEKDKQHANGATHDLDGERQVQLHNSSVSATSPAENEKEANGVVKEELPGNPTTVTVQPENEEPQTKLVQELVIQFEDTNGDALINSDVDMRVRTDVTSTPPPKKRHAKPKRAFEKAKLAKEVPEPKACYVNEGFHVDNTDMGEELELVHEIDGTKTYRSAEGIPMTSL